MKTDPLIPTTVAVVEDDPHAQARMVKVMAQDPSLRLSYNTDSGSELLKWFADNPVDVLLVDLGLPDIPGIRVIKACATRRPACSIMVISIFGDEKNMLDAFEAGARGYLLKDGTEAELSGHIRNLHNGGSPISPLIARKLLLRLSGSRPTSAVPDSTLSPREHHVLDLVARGFTYPEVAEQISVTLNTVHTHIRNIYGKLGVHNKTEAIFEARNIGLLP